MFSVPESSKIRQSVLQSMANKYHLTFSPDEKFLFNANGVVNTPTTQLKDNIYKNEEEPSANGTGIPLSPGNDELYQWVRESRLSARAFFSRDIFFTIDADSQTCPSKIKHVINILKSQKLGGIQLITDKDTTDIRFEYPISY